MLFSAFLSTKLLIGASLLLYWIYVQIELLRAVVNVFHRKENPEDYFHLKSPSSMITGAIVVKFISLVVPTWFVVSGVYYAYPILLLEIYKINILLALWQLIRDEERGLNDVNLPHSNNLLRVTTRHVSSPSNIGKGVLVI